MKFGVIAFAVSMVFASAVQADTTISTIDYGYGSIRSFGVGGNTATYGQTITTGDEAVILTSFTFYLGPLSAPFTAEVGTWTGSSVGEIIYQSAPITFDTVGDDFTPVTATPVVTLAANSEYVLYFTTSGLDDPQNYGNYPANSWGYVANDLYAGGDFVYLSNSDNDRDQLTSANWTIYHGGGDLAFVATLAPVPEPATYGLMLAGLGLVGFAARRARSV